VAVLDLPDLKLKTGISHRYLRPTQAIVDYTEGDIPDLVAGALKQERLLAVAPKPVTEQDLRHIITASMTNW
jgi:alcohol dehydrogenase class IV